MKKIILTLIIATTAIFSVNAQEEGKFRVSLDLGYAIPTSGGGGIAIYLEPAYNIKDNMRVGLRIGSASLIKEIKPLGDDKKTEGKIGANGSYLGTFDYSFNKKNSHFVPYIGAGIGYFSVANIEFDDFDALDKIEASGKFGGMIRGGFECKKFRLGVDFNLVPESKLEDLSGKKIGTAKNSYFGISLGFFLGGGKWGQ